MKKAYLLPIILLLGAFGLFFTIPVAPVAAASVTHFFDDFESGLSNLWTTSGDWHIEDNASSNYPITDPTITIPSGTHYMWFGDNTTGTYNNLSGYLTWGPLDLSSISGKIEVSYYGWLYHWNEYLDIQYSPDGVSWYYPFSGWFSAHTVQFSQLSFEVPHYGKTSTFYCRFRFLQNTLYGESEFGWRIDDVTITETPDYSVEFQQLGEERATLGETRHLGYSVKLLYSASQVTDILVNITTPSGGQVVVYDDSVTIESGGGWAYSQDYTFTEEGDYNFSIIVTDEQGSQFSESKIWKVGPYVLMYRIDNGYFANIGETKEMDFRLISFYDVNTYFNISILLETPSGVNITIYDEQTEIFAYEEYQFSTTFSFLENGYHRVFIVVMDSRGKIQEVYDSSWDIGPYFATWVENIEPYEVEFVGDIIPFSIFVEAKTNKSSEIDVFVKIIDPNFVLEALYEEKNILLNPSDIWNINLPYTCRIAGQYQMDIEITNSSNTAEIWWGDRVHWSAIEELTLWIDQAAYSIPLGDEGTTSFNLVNHYGYAREVDIHISIESPSNSESILHEESITLQTGESWTKLINYTFDELGRYDIEFQVIDDSGKEWLADSWWRSQGEDSTTETTPSLTSPGYEIFVSFLTVLIMTSVIQFYTKRKR
ncbi:MAG: COG1470 family protein [Candidatus Hodarchaeales archaeon]|jgi:hypothetical protein